MIGQNSSIQQDFRSINEMIELVKNTGLPTYNTIRTNFNKIKELIEKEIYSIK